MATGTSPLQLESVVTQVLMNVDEVIAGRRVLTETLDAMEGRLIKFGESMVATTSLIEGTVAASTAALEGTLAKLLPLEGALVPLETSALAMATAVGRMTTATDSIPRMSESFKTLQEPLSKLESTVNAIARLPQALGGVADTGGISEGLRATGSALKGLTEPTRLLTGATNRISALVDPIAKLADAAVKLKDVGGYIGQTGKGLGQLTEGSERLRVTAGRLDAVVKPIGAIADEISKLGGAKANLTELVEGMSKVARSSVSMDKAAKAIKGLGTAISSFAGLATTAPGNITTLSDSLGNLAKHAPNLASLSGNLNILMKTVGGAGAVAGLAEGIGQLENLSRFMVRLARSAVPVGVLNTHLTNLMGTLSGPGMGDFSGFTRSLEQIGNFLLANESKGRIDRSLPALGKHLRAFGDDMAAWAGQVSNLGNLGDVSRVFGRIGGFLDSARRFKPDPNMAWGITQLLDGVLTPLRNLQGLNLTELGEVSKVFGRVGSFLDSARKFTFDPAHMQGIAQALNAVLTPLGTASAMLNIEQAGKAFQRIGSVMNAAMKTDPAVLGNVLTPIRDLMTHLSTLQGSPVSRNVSMALGGLRRQLLEIVKIDPGRLGAVVASVGPLMATMQSMQGLTVGTTAFKAMGTLANSLARMSYINPANLLAVANTTKTVMATLNALPASPNLVRTATIINRLSNAMSGMAAAGRAGGGGKGPFGTVPVAIPGGIPPAANRASSAVGGMSTSMRGASLSANAMSGSLTVLRFSMLGIAGFGAASFASLDDALLRTMAHAQDYGQTTRRELFEGAIGLSSKSTSSALNTVKALDILQASGMNTSMALKAVKTAEDLAVVSGTDLVTITRKLIDAQTAMGLNSEDVAQNLGNLTMMADTFAGVATRVGSTELQLMESLTGRLAATVMDTGTSFEDLIAVMGVYSRLGQQFRGASGGNIVAKAVRELNDAVLRNPVMWKQMLGDGNVVVDQEGKIKSLIDVIDAMQEKMANVGSMQYLAELNQLGFHPRDVDVLKPLLQSGTRLREFRNEIAMMGDTARVNADMIRGSLSNQFKILWNNITDVTVVVGHRLAPVFEMMIGGVMAATQWFLKLNPALQNLALIFGAVVLGGYPALRLITSLSLAVLDFVTMPLRMLYSAFVGLAGIASSALLGALSAVAGGVASVYSAFHTLGTMVLDVWTGTTSLLGTLRKAFDVITIGFLNVAVNVGTTLLGLLSSVVLLIPAIIVGFVAMLPVLAALPLVIGLAGATVVVFGQAVVALGGLIGSGLVAAWGAVKSAAVNAMGWIGSRVESLRSDVSGIWEGMRESMQNFVRTMAIGISVMAGFMWNFRDNMRTVFNWLERYGEYAFTDLAKAGFKAAEIIGGNFQQMLSAIGQTIVIGLTTAWKTASLFVGAVFTWISEQWKFALHDMGLVMGVFFQNLAKNFTTLSSAFTKLADAALAESMFRGFYFGEGLKNFDKSVADQRKAAYAELASGMTPLTAGMEGINERDLKFDRDMYGLTQSERTGFKPAFAQSKEDWDRAGKQIAAAFTEHLSMMKPLASAFAWIAESPMWRMLFKDINTTLPEDFVSKLVDSYRKMFGPPTEGEGTGEAYGKQGPGFSFKQISLERTMVGGPVAENLDFQQLVTLKMIDQKLGIIIQQRGLNPNAPKPAVGP
jgi:TP901 family phage tail tape measure protein